MRFLITLFFSGFICISTAQIQDYKALLSSYQNQAKTIDDTTILIINAANKKIPLNTVINNIQASPTTDSIIFTNANITKIYDLKLNRLEVLSLYFLTLSKNLSMISDEKITLLDNGDEIQQPLSEIIDFIDVGCNNALRVLLEKLEIERQNGVLHDQLTQSVRNQYSRDLNKILTNEVLLKFYQNRLNAADIMQICYAHLFDDYKAIVK